MQTSGARGRRRDAKDRQRERILMGMLGAVNEEGYTGATIASVIARAGVSRPTFYEYFSDKNDCFLALYRDLSGQLLDRIADAVNDSPPERAIHAVVRQLAGHAEKEPVQGQFLASGILSGGPAAIDARARTLKEICNRVQAAKAAASLKRPSPDLPAQAVVSATQWLIEQRVRRRERNLTQLSQELAGWLDYYERPIADHRWSVLSPGPAPEPSPQRSELSAERPAAFLKGSRRRPSSQSKHWRILYAAAESAAQSGYAAATVTAIVTRARLNKTVFYDYFRDKQHAFLTLHELAYQETMTIGAGAYFSAKHSPERVWRCLLAVSQFHAAHPALAHVGLIETHALGLPAIQRVEESRHAFAILLRADGPHTSQRPTMTAAEAIGAAIFEIAQDRVRHQRAGDLPRYAYHATYLALAPFLGVQAANRFVQRKLEDAERTPVRPKRHKRS